MNEELLCKKCGCKMEHFIKDSTCGATCKNCGWGWATTYQEPIKLDGTDYVLCVNPIINPSIDAIRCIARLLACIFVIAKNKLQSKIIFTQKATVIHDIAEELVKNGIHFNITPDFPYEI